jgi:TIR domain
MSANLDTWRAYAPPPAPLGPGQKWSVFLSYRSANRPWVINLYDVLRSHGHAVFLDQVTSAAGDRPMPALENALESSQAGVLVWSTAAADSDWVRQAYEVISMRALRGGFHFVPVRLDVAELPTFARLRVFLDFSGYPAGPSGGELLKLLHGVVGTALSPEGVRFANEQDDAARLANAEIEALVRSGRAEKLRALCDKGGLAWEISAALGCAAAEGLTKLEAYDAALAVVGQLESRFPRAIRPKQLRALALTRRGRPGDHAEAQDLLGAFAHLPDRP